MSVTRTIAKNTLFNFITTASDQLIHFGTGILLARYLGPDSYGLYAFLYWFLTLGIYLSNLGLGYMLERFVSEAIGQNDINNAKNFTKIAIWLRIAAAALVTLVIIVFAGFWSEIFGHPENQFLFILISFGLLPYVLNFILTSVFAGFQKYEYNAYLTLATSPLRAIGLIIVAIMGGGVQEVISVNIGTWVLGVFVGLFLLRRLIPIRTLVTPLRMNDRIKAGLKYSMVMTGIFFINYFLVQRAEVLFLGMFEPDTSVGFYTIAFMIPISSVGLILSVFSQVLVPAISQQFGRGDIDRIREIYITAGRFLMMVGLPLAIGGIVLSGSIITVIYGTDYAPVIPLVQIMFIPFAIMGISSAAVGVIYGMNQPSYIFKVGLGLVVLDIGLNLWLIQAYGVIGAAIGSSIPRLIAPIFYIRFASRQCGVSWPFSDTIKIICSSIIMGAIIFGIQYFIDNPIINLIALVPLGFILQIFCMIVFKVMGEKEITIFRRVQSGLPSGPQKIFGSIIGLLESLVKWRNRTAVVKE